MAPPHKRRPAAEPIQLGGWEAGTKHVFTSADGTEYGMPDPVPAELSLNAMELYRDEGEAAATLWLLTECFGDEGYEKLKTEASNKQLRAVGDIVSDHVLGEMEGN